MNVWKFSNSLEWERLDDRPDLVFGFDFSSSADFVLLLRVKLKLLNFVKTKMESLHVNTLIELPSVANALATDIFCEVNSSVVFRKKFSGCAGHIHFDRGMFVSGGVRQSGNFYYKLLSSDSNTLSKSYLDDIKEDKSRIK